MSQINQLNNLLLRFPSIVSHYPITLCFHWSPIIQFDNKFFLDVSVSTRDTRSSKINHSELQPYFTSSQKVLIIFNQFIKSFLIRSKFETQFRSFRCLNWNTTGCVSLFTSGAFWSYNLRAAQARDWLLCVLKLKALFPGNAQIPDAWASLLIVVYGSSLESWMSPIYGAFVNEWVKYLMLIWRYITISLILSIWVYSAAIAVCWWFVLLRFLFMKRRHLHVFFKHSCVPISNENAVLKPRKSTLLQCCISYTVSIFNS